MTLIAGQLLALALLLVLQASMGEAALESWGWRIAFALGAVLAIVVFFIRRRLTRRCSYERVAAQGADGANRADDNLIPRSSARGVAGRSR